MAELLAKMERISPKLARSILDDNVDYNRPVTPSRVDKYAKDMANGAWETHTGESLKFSKTGKLLDGQHRLHAIVKSGLTLEFMVVRGLDESVFSKIDTGKTRNGGDVVAIETGLSAVVSAAISAASQMAIVYESRPGAVPDIKNSGHNRGSATAARSNDGILAFIRKNQDIVEAAKFVNENYRNGCLLSRSVLTWACFQCRRLNPDEADCFILDIIQGSALTANDPVFGLREVLIADRSARRKAGRDAVLGALVKAWNRRRTPGRGTMLHSTLLRVDYQTFPRFL